MLGEGIVIEENGSRGAQAALEAATKSHPFSVNRPYAIIALLIFGGYMALAIGLYFWRGIYFRPDMWAIALFVAAIVFGQWKTFLRDWIPVVLLLFGYEFMRGIAGQMMEADHYKGVHVTELLTAERALFGGTLPTLWLQDKLYTPGIIHWYDVLAVLIYALHFVFPLVFAFMLWVGSKERFWQFSLTFLLMNYTAFAFYLAYPTASPWVADEWGYIHGVVMPFDQAIHVLVPQVSHTFNTLEIWGKLSGNPVAALPSLHAAYPWLVLLFAVKFFGRPGLLFLAYNVALWFTVVYLGHHWVVDILAGMAWATACYILVQLLWPRIVGGLRVPFLRRTSPLGSGHSGDGGGGPNLP